jgi:2-polyprenyl-3-methyl-5-hydroxy-6-metoxy-1,4-benzoquinol methylase
MDLKATYNSIAAAWQDHHASDNWWIPATNAFIAQLPAGARVLDVGCGGGDKAHYLAEHGCVVEGIDFAEEMVALAQRRFPSVPFRVLDLHDIGLLSDQYDGIYAAAVLLHVPKKEIPQVLDSFFQRVRSGGSVFLGLKEQSPTGQEEEMVSDVKYGIPTDRFFSFFKKEEIRDLLAQAGFTDIAILEQPSGSLVWLNALAKKP